MNIVDWRELESMSGAALREALFTASLSIARNVQLRDRDDPELLESVPRIARLVEQHEELRDFEPILNALARTVGLWNYIDRKHADVPEALVAEAAAIPELDDIVFHREQLSALGVLLSGRNLILSAPTSFGKSLIVDALLASGKYSRVAIVLPTIALMDEFRRRLDERFGAAFDVVMHHSETPKRDQVVFIGTQERLINRDDLGNLDLAIVDEFYKLDPSRSDQRSVILNAAVYKLLSKARQFFFLGPNIDAVIVHPESRWHFQFIKTRFSTVAVNTFDLKNVPDRDERLVEEIYLEVNWPALVFISSPDRANALAAELIARDVYIGAGSELSEWIDTNFGPGWPLSQAVNAGIGVHHGRVPRALASRFIKLFNDGALPILLCTSTLIEGVNTAAKSVFIYDKSINKEDYDFFTFSNIRGRAGRLGRHHVGNVYLFHGQPQATEVDVTSPLFGDFDAAPDELVMYMDQADVTPEIQTRIDDVSRRLGLSTALIRRYAALGFDKLERLRDVVLAHERKSVRAMAWSNWPRYAELLTICTLICQVVEPHREFGLASGKQLAYYLSQLSRAHSIKAFYLWHAGTYKGKAVSMDNVFKFLRSCEYSLPELFLAIQDMCGEDDIPANYSVYVTAMQHWFKHEALKVLEEQGVPMQISERFVQADDSVSDLRTRLRRAAESQSGAMTDVETRWILDALPR